MRKLFPLLLTLFFFVAPAFAQQQSGGGPQTTINVGPGNADSGTNAQAILVPVAPVTNNWYTGFMQNQVTGNAAVASRIACAPMVIPTTITVKALGARVTTVGSSNFQLAIYANSGGFPNGAALASTGNISNTTATTATGTVTAVTLTPNVYWACSNCNDSTMVLQGPGPSVSVGGWTVGGTTAGVVSASGNAGMIGWFYSGTFGTWPSLSSTGASAESVQQAPVLLMESQ